MNNADTGFNPLDRVMWALSGDEGTGSEAEVVDSDLDVMRLLVEIGRLEQVNLCSLVYGVLWRFLLGYYHFPALEYLCKQEFFDFNLRDVLDFCVSESHLVIPVLDRDQLPFVLKTLFACGGGTTTASNAKGDPLIVAVLAKYVSVTFKDDGEHLKGFNSAVITFSLLLKYWFNPSTKLYFEGSQCTVSEIADMADPDFTGVAWQHALALNGWGPPSNKSDDEINDDSQARNEGRSQNESESGSENERDGDIGDETKGKAEEVTLGDKEVNTTEVSEESQHVPGAWVAEQPESKFPTVRKFRSSPGDFTSTINGRIWEPGLYLRS